MVIKCCNGIFIEQVMALVIHNWGCASAPLGGGDLAVTAPVAPAGGALIVKTSASAATVLNATMKLVSLVVTLITLL